MIHDGRWGRAYNLNVVTRLHTRLGWPIAKAFANQGFVAVVLLDVSEFSMTDCVPGEAEPTMDISETRIVWRLEIQGCVIGRADFNRTFLVVVE